MPSGELRSILGAMLPYLRFGFIVLALGSLSTACGGSDGEQGASGSEGETGPEGPEGPRGQEGPEGPEGPQGPEGPEGPQGPEGNPGELRVYGDGSAGSITVEGSVLLSDLLSDGNLQFEDLTIPAGAELIVPSGVTLRASGSITVEGTLRVEAAAWGGIIIFPSTTVLWPFFQYPDAGIAESAPGTPGVVLGDEEIAYEGFVADGLHSRARYLFSPGRLGGGGGWLGPGGGQLDAVLGGGSLVVIARESLTITGTIDAQGGGLQRPFTSCDACSGGGGGVVILAARGSLTTSPAALIDARGGNGGNLALYLDSPRPGVLPALMGAGGGGGGGCVHLIAPSIVHEGDVNVTGGSPGSGTVVGEVPDLRIGGAGGGASCGNGGRGARINIDSSTNPASEGTVGQYFRTEADPTALL